METEYERCQERDRFPRRWDGSVHSHGRTILPSAENWAENTRHGASVGRVLQCWVD